MVFYANVYPDEMAENLIRIADWADDQAFLDSVTDALYNLKGIAENKYNDEGYRNLYRLLEEVVKTN